MKKYLYVLAALYFLLTALKKIAVKDNKAPKSDPLDPSSTSKSEKRSDHMWKDYNLATKEDFKAAFIAENMQDEWPHFEKLLRPEVRIIPTWVNESELELGQSKIGGSPDLPLGMAWPLFEGRELSFLAQINLEEVAALRAASELPDSGMLYFFCVYDLAVNGDKIEDKDGFRVIHLKKPIEISRSQSSRDDDTKKGAAYRSCKLHFADAWNLPSSSWPGVRELLSGDDFERMRDFRSPPDMAKRTKLLGYANEVQGDMEGLCEWLLGDSDKKKWADNWRAGVENWRLLFQLDSESEAMMEFGDTGRLYFWIKEQDLKAGNLEKTWMMLQYH